MPVLVAAAAEVKTLLGEQSFTPAVTWHRKYLPPVNIENVGTMGIVAPAAAGSERSRFTRGASSQTRSKVIRIGIVSAVDQIDNDSIDARVSLVESVIEALEQNETVTYGAADLIELVQLWSEDGVKAGLFQSIIDATYIDFT